MPKKNIYVSGGNLSSPFYEFYVDSKGKNKISSLELNSNYKYFFYKLNNLNSHPFYVTDTSIGSPTSSSIKLSGDGDFNDGIKGDEYFILQFNKQKEEIKKLYFFCTAHNNMNGVFSIINWNKYVFNSKPQLMIAINLWSKNSSKSEKKFGKMNSWDISDFNSTKEKSKKSGKFFKGSKKDDILIGHSLNDTLLTLKSNFIGCLRFIIISICF